MNNFTKIGVIALMLLWSTAFHGQHRPSRDKIKTLKVAFITERLNLSSTEAQKFWPVYNQHEENIEDLRRQEREEIRAKLRDFDALPESEANELLGKLIALEKAKHQVNAAYLKKLSEVISSKKTFLLIRAEEDFKKRLLREIQQRRKGGGGFR
jgi:DNA helicase IV